jgi:outer membrane protein OmpA-like peptidoglycan-associated protein
MTFARGVLVLVAVTAGLHTACGPLRSRTPQRKADTTVVLLAEPDGSAGSAVVSNQAGTAELGTARAMTRVAVGVAPTAVTEMSEADIKRLFGAALDVQPPAPIHFTLFFQFDSEELTEESRKLISDVLLAVKSYPAPQVTVVGHTDTTGTPDSNVELGLRRANVVRLRLIETGLDGSAMNVTSHGEATLLVPTADDVSEPKNRRVDITVR